MPNPDSSSSTAPTPESSTASMVSHNRRVQNSARWFWWIAGLSLVNTLIHHFGGGVTFLFGLAVTQIFDGFFHGVPAASYALDIVPLGFFILIGYFATKGQVWAFIVGGIAYLLDGMIYIAFSTWLPVLFHAFVLVSIFFGVRELLRLKALAKSADGQPV